MTKGDVLSLVWCGLLLCLLWRLMPFLAMIIGGAVLIALLAFLGVILYAAIGGGE